MAFVKRGIGHIVHIIDKPSEIKEEDLKKALADEKATRAKQSVKSSEKK